MSNKKILGILIPTSTLTLIAMTLLALAIHSLASPWITQNAIKIIWGSIITILILVVIGVVSINEITGGLKKRF